MREILGMAIVLFAVLAFICLITGDALFYTLGSSVRGFLLALFGVYSFFVLFDLVLVGLKLTSDKSVIPTKSRKKYFVIRVAVLCVFVIVHLAVSVNVKEGLGFNVSNAYKSGLGGFASTTALGVIGSLLTSPILALASVFGTYALYSIILLLCLAYVFKNLIFSVKRSPKENVARGSGRGDRHDNKKDKRTGDGIVEEAPLIADEGFVESRQKRGFFISEDSAFAKKSKKDVAEGARNADTTFTGRFEFKGEQSKATAPVKETEPRRPIFVDGGEKIDLRTRKDSVQDMGRSYDDYVGRVKRTDVSGVIPREDNGVRPIDGEFVRNVYTVPVDRPEGRDNGERTSVETSPFGTRTDSREETRNVFGGRFGVAEDASENNYSDITRNETPSDRSGNDAFTDLGDDRANSFLRGDPTESKDGDDEMNVRYGEIKDFERPLRGVKDREPDPVDKEDDGDGNTDDFPDEDIEKTNVPPYRGGSFTKEPVRDPSPMRGEQISIFNKPKPKFVIPDDGSEPIENMPVDYDYKRPPVTLLSDYKQDDQQTWEERGRQKWCAETIVKVIKVKKNIDVVVEDIVTGPAVTRYDISIPDTVSPSEIYSTRQDLSFRLQTGGELRMYSIPYTSHIGIEIANRFPRTVGLKEVLMSDSYEKAAQKSGLHFVYGEDLLGNAITMNINAMPHLLVCGTTGSGKSICLNTMLVSLIYRYSPAEFRLIIIDPKKVEFKNFKNLPHLVFNDILGLDNRAIAVLEWAVNEMDRRYDLFADLGYKDIFEFNRYAAEKGEKKMPCILILIDEFAELVMAQPQNKKKIETYIGRLAQKARSAGISLICATQRASVNVITGSIKANIASRICFKTSSPVDSRVILDEQGADKLLGRGDGLYKTTEDSTLHRGQGAFISNEEVKKVVAYVVENNKCYYDNKLLETINAAANEDEEDKDMPRSSAVKANPTRPDEVDEDYKRALCFAIKRKVVSGSSLRTILRIGYNKSATIINWMEKMGYITPILENRMRNVLFTREEYENTYGEFIEDID